MIYLDHAATSLPKPEPVVLAVTAAMNCLGNSGRGAHSASLGASRMIYETREALCDFLEETVRSRWPLRLTLRLP